MSDAEPRPKLSIICPVYNERENLPRFIEHTAETMKKLGLTYEIIAVDDGSTDGSYEMLRSLRVREPNLSIIRFRRNFGQTAALSAGIEHARGEILVTIDSDLENDPRDIGLLLAKLEEGHDLVSGWRKNRWSNATFTRKIPSLAANTLITRATGVALHDYGCTLKAYRASLIKDVRLYGEMHRFIPAYVAWQGGTITEIPVSYTPRTYGASNYGISRLPRVLLDMIVVVFLHKYLNRPMHFFGGWGLVSVFVGFLAGFAAILLRLFNIKHLVDTPLPLFGVFCIIVGVQLVMFGVIGEMLMRTYYESQQRRPYTIAEII